MATMGDLMRLVPVSERYVEKIDWEALESQIDTRLPGDYKLLAKQYGQGLFDGFLSIFQPVSLSDSVWLEKQVERTSWALDYLRGVGELVPYENAELLSVFQSDNGDVGYWLRRPENDPDSWTIVVNEARGPVWATFNGGLVKFLVAVLSGECTISVFPEDFPSGHPGFQPYGE